MHSPSVGPAIWQGVADRLRDKGIDVRVPSFIGVGEGPAPYWPQVIQRAVHSVGNDARPVVIVPHSNAGLFVPLVVDRLGERAAACVFVDASLPPAEGEAAMVPAEFVPFLRAKAVDGILPRWSDWWEEEEVASLYPDQKTRSALTADEPRLPLAYYEQTARFLPRDVARPGASDGVWLSSRSDSTGPGIGCAPNSEGGVPWGKPSSGWAGTDLRPRIKRWSLAISTWTREFE